MTLKLLPISLNPESTVYTFRAAFPLRDALGTLYADEAFADLYLAHGQPSFAPCSLTFVTVFLFMKGLTNPPARAEISSKTRCGNNYRIYSLAAETKTVEEGKTLV